jgi:hypothetical protein
MTKKKGDLKISTRLWPMTVRAGTKKSARKPLHEPHYEIYDCRPLRIQLYPREIRFIKLRRWSSLSTIEETCGETLFYTAYGININEDNRLADNFAINISDHTAVFKHITVIDYINYFYKNVYMLLDKPRNREEKF